MEYNLQQNLGYCPTMPNPCSDSQQDGAGARGKYYYASPSNLDACFGSAHPGKVCEDRLCAIFGGHDGESSYAAPCYEHIKKPKREINTLGAPIGLIKSSYTMSTLDLDIAELQPQRFATILKTFANLYLMPETNWSTHTIDEVMQEGQKLYADSQDDPPTDQYPNSIYNDYESRVKREFYYQNILFRIELNDKYLLNPVLNENEEETDPQDFPIEYLDATIRKYFQEGRKYCLLMLNDWYLMIWHSFGVYFVIDYYGRRILDFQSDREEGVAMMLCLRNIENVLHLVLNLSNLEPEDTFNIRELRVVKLTTADGKTLTREYVKRVNKYIIISTDLAYIKAFLHLTLNPDDPVRNRSALPTAVAALIASKIDHPATWTGKQLDRLMCYGVNVCRCCWTNCLQNKTPIQVDEFPRILKFGQFIVQFWLEPRVARGLWRCVPNYKQNELSTALQQLLEAGNDKLVLQIEHQMYAIFQKNGYIYLFDPFRHRVQGDIDPENLDEKTASLRMFRSVDLFLNVLNQVLGEYTKTNKFYIHALHIRRIELSERAMNTPLAEKELAEGYDVQSLNDYICFEEDEIRCYIELGEISDFGDDDQEVPPEEPEPSSETEIGEEMEEEGEGGALGEVGEIETSSSDEEGKHRKGKGSSVGRGKRGSSRDKRGSKSITKTIDYGADTTEKGKQKTAETEKNKLQDSTGLGKKTGERLSATVGTPDKVGNESMGKTSQKGKMSEKIPSEGKMTADDDRLKLDKKDKTKRSGNEQTQNKVTDDRGQPRTSTGKEKTQLKQVGDKTKESREEMEKQKTGKDELGKQKTGKETDKQKQEDDKNKQKSTREDADKQKTSKDDAEKTGRDSLTKQKIGKDVDQRKVGKEEQVKQNVGKDAEKQKTGKEAETSGKEGTRTGKDEAKTGKDEAKTGKEGARTTKDGAQTTKEVAQTGKDRPSISKEGSPASKAVTIASKEGVPAGKERVQGSKEVRLSGKEVRISSKEGTPASKEGRRASKEVVPTGKESGSSVKEGSKELGKRDSDKKTSGKQDLDKQKSVKESTVEKQKTGKNKIDVYEKTDKYSHITISPSRADLHDVDKDAQSIYSKEGETVVRRSIDKHKKTEEVSLKKPAAEKEPQELKVTQYEEKKQTSKQVLVVEQKTKIEIQKKVKEDYKKIDKLDKMERDSYRGKPGAIEDKVSTDRFGSFTYNAEDESDRPGDTDVDKYAEYGGIEGLLDDTDIDLIDSEQVPSPPLIIEPEKVKPRRRRKRTKGLKPHIPTITAQRGCVLKRNKFVIDGWCSYRNKRDKHLKADEVCRRVLAEAQCKEQKEQERRQGKDAICDKGYESDEIVPHPYMVCNEGKYPGFSDTPNDMAVVGSETGSYESIIKLLRAGFQCTDRVLLMTRENNFVLFRVAKQKKSTFFVYDGCTCNMNRFRHFDLNYGTAGLICTPTLHDAVCCIRYLRSKLCPKKQNKIQVDTVENIVAQYVK